MSDLKGRLESTLLSQSASEKEIGALCREAIALGVRGVCVAGARLGRARELLAGTGLVMVSIAGFPLGNQRREVKLFEVGHLFEAGADEVDMVMNVGLFLEGRHAPVINEIAAAKREAGPRVLKVIVETSALPVDLVSMAAKLVADAGADYVKTSTGFGARGASVEDVKVFRRALKGTGCRIKASGGIRTKAFADELVSAGADVLGTSCASAILG